MTTVRLSSKHLVKALFITAVATAVYFIPGNAEFIYGYGESSVLPGSTTLPKQCNSQKPAAPVLFQPVTAGQNTVKLRWSKVALSGKYTLGYGVAAGNYIYGVADMGDTDNITVGYLTPGKKFYFAVRGVNDCTPGAWSNEVAYNNGGYSGGTTGTTGYTTPRVVGPSAGYPTAAPTYYYKSPTSGPGQNSTISQPPANLPTPTPAQQPGFFQGILDFFTGLFGGK